MSRRASATMNAELACAAQHATATRRWADRPALSSAGAGSRITSGQRAAEDEGDRRHHHGGGPHLRSASRGAASTIRHRPSRCLRWRTRHPGCRSWRPARQTHQQEGRICYCPYQVEVSPEALIGQYEPSTPTVNRTSANRMSGWSSFGHTSAETQDTDRRTEWRARENECQSGP